MFTASSIAVRWLLCTFVVFATYNDKRHNAEDLARLAVTAAAEFNDGTGLPCTSFKFKLARQGR